MCVRKHMRVCVCIVYVCVRLRLTKCVRECVMCVRKHMRVCVCIVYVCVRERAKENAERKRAQGGEPRERERECARARQ